MEWIQRFGLPGLLVAGFAEFMGVPFPGGPVLLAGGALAGPGTFSLPLAWAAAALGAILADQIWYGLARARGERLLATACQVSVNPKACLCQTMSYMERFGAPALLFVKLIPGVSSMATPVAGISGIGRGRFTVYSLLGSTIWAGFWTGLGHLFRSSLLPVIEPVLTWAPRAVGVLIVVALILLAAKVLAGWWAVRNDPHPEGTHPQNPFRSERPATGRKREA